MTDYSPAKDVPVEDILEEVEDTEAEEEAEDDDEVDDDEEEPEGK